jgi:hypothetical protein
MSQIPTPINHPLHLSAISVQAFTDFLLSVFKYFLSRPCLIRANHTPQPLHPSPCNIRYHIYIYIYIYIYIFPVASTFEHRVSVKRFVSLQSVGLLGRGISPSQGRYLHEHRINTHRDIHALSGIRTFDPSVRSGEDSSCLRPRGHWDWPVVISGI